MKKEIEKQVERARMRMEAKGFKPFTIERARRKDAI
jgi:hypothetical protein